MNMNANLKLPNEERGERSNRLLTGQDANPRRVQKRHRPSRARRTEGPRVRTRSSPTIDATPDRRARIRFPICEEVRYRLFDAGAEISGVGRTVNFSSRGILFTTENRLPLQCRVQLSVNWPARLDGSCPLKFVAESSVVRADAFRAAVVIERYEFKTRGRDLVAALPPGKGRANPTATAA